MEELRKNYSQKIKRFNYDDIPRPIDKKTLFSMIISGSSRSGKTFFLADLLDKRLKYLYDFVVIFSSTDTSDFEKVLDPNRTIVRNYIDMGLIERIKQRNRNGGKEKVLLIFDDLGNSELVKDPEFINLYTLGRHYNLSVIFLNQFYSMCRPSIRANTLYQIIFSVQGRNREELIRENLLGSFWKETGERVKFAELDKMVGTLTTDYNALIMKFSNKSIFIEDLVETYKVHQQGSLHLRPALYPTR